MVDERSYRMGDWISLNVDLPPDDTPCLFRSINSNGVYCYAVLTKYNPAKHRQYTHWTVIDNGGSDD